MPEAPLPTIDAVRSPEDLATAITLFRAYAASLPVDLGYQGFEAEMAALPGKYAPPEGDLLLARDARGIARGCVGLRRFGTAGECEMKRLYVAPEGRGLGLGKALAEAVIEIARARGYRALLLDTLATMAAAQALYRSLGFETVPAYYETPIAGTIFMRLDLLGTA
jgi:ribosomal protein S18 acetylase RimI-like enzyme